MLLEEHILSIVLQADNPAMSLEDVELIIPIENIPVSAAAKILLMLKQYQTKGKFKVAKFIESLNKELIPVADKAYIVDIGSKGKSELKRSASELRRLLLREELKKTTIMLKKLEKEGAGEKSLDELNQEISNLTRKIKKG
jgi:hypothetical protein